MTSPAFVQAPTDASNTGKKIRTVTRVVGANTVHEHVVVPVDGRDILGIYYGHSGLLTIQAAAHTADAGFIYLINPIGSGIVMALRRVAYQGAPTSTTARPTTRITAERFTFTGTHSGAVMAAGKGKPDDPAPEGRIADNSTGLAVTPVGAVHRAFLVPAVASGNNVTSAPTEIVWEPLTTDGETWLAPGGGLLLRQADAGSSGDDRDLLFNVAWAEFAQ